MPENEMTEADVIALNAILAHVRNHALTREQAIKWISTEARDSRTEFGFSAEQAEIMANGRYAGKGYRDDSPEWREAMEMLWDSE